MPRHASETTKANLACCGGFTSRLFLENTSQLNKGITRFSLPMKYGEHSKLQVPAIQHIIEQMPALGLRC